jgi:hypothetical protein
MTAHVKAIALSNREELKVTGNRVRQPDDLAGGLPSVAMVAVEKPY